MIRSKHGVKVLGLCALALGLITLYTSTSQAEEGASWKVNGKSYKEWTAGLLPEIQVRELLNKTISLLATTGGGTKVDLLCTEAAFIGAKLEANGSITPGNKTKFSGCVMLLNGKLSASCQPHTGAEKGVLVSNALKGLLVLHEGKSLIRFDPVVGTTFVNVLLGEECSIGEECAITGFSSVKESSGKIGTEQVVHIVEQEPSFSELKFGGQPATVDGAAALQLTGAHAGLAWAGIPG